MAIACAFAAWAVWEKMEVSRLSDEVVSLENKLTMAVAAGRKLPAAAGAESRDTAAARTAAAGREKDKDSNPVQPGSEGKSMAEGLAKMMEDPKMRDAFKAQARMGIDMMYRDLFDLLDLKEPKKSQLEKLVSEKAATGMELGFSMMGAKKSPEEIKKLSDELMAKTRDYDAKIKDLLGEDDFTKLKRYEDSTNERMQLKTFSGMLASKNLEMDESTETRLMDAMYQERQKFPFANSFSSQQNTDMSRFSEDNIQKFGTEYSQLNQNIVSRAGEILSPPQLEVFKESQTQMETMVKMHIEMAGKMFGSGAAAPNP